ncbi:hypothetical protein AB0M32_46020 [Streptomyces sp. NPDC051985]|uniref:hypothetical protein n=1 Tax=Streptomyces sp. NPDC051985 TaxID=3155807 RepID=UPI00341430A9
MGCYALGDTTDRIRAAADIAGRWWPWALLGLALVNLLRSAVSAESLIGPLTLGAVAAGGLLLSRKGGGWAFADWVLPVVLALAGACLVLTDAPRTPTTRWSRVLSTGRVVVPPDSGPLLTLRAVLGDLRADLTRLESGAERTTVHVTAVGGHVRLVVPREQPISVHRSGAALTRLTHTDDHALGIPGGKDRLTVHVLGLCGAVSIVRT